MSRAWQADRQAEREQSAIDTLYAEGALTVDEYRQACRDLEREVRDAYEADREDALGRVRDEWGY